MASQKSTAATAALPSPPAPSQDAGPAKGAAPKRARGRQTVAALMDAATQVFAEKGYDATTMTEIAARSGTAIGSLYRFFPSKDAMAEAVLLRYGQRTGAALDGLVVRAASLATATARADALVDLMLGLRGERAVVKVLMDSRPDAAAKRGYMRSEVSTRIARLLIAWAPALPPDRASVLALMVLFLMKTVPELMETDEADALLGEVRVVLRAYLAAALHDPASAE
ncbi:MAG: helix-turn-helix domain containing protein [Azospirillaceae bacterium]|nr:helix-turn-helix domain containing protein [Azospirillaceae bacterium]